jgi:cellulase/cellobiase CelA1
VWKFFAQFQTSTPPADTATCRVTSTVSAWNSGLTANITLTNTGTTAINGWSLAFTLPAGQTITSGWNAGYSPGSGRVTATSASHNATIAPGASVGIGYQATHTGDTAAPDAYTLNGTDCAVTGVRRG